MSSMESDSTGPTPSHSTATERVKRFFDQRDWKFYCALAAGVGLVGAAGVYYYYYHSISSGRRPRSPNNGSYRKSKAAGKQCYMLHQQKRLTTWYSWQDNNTITCWIWRYATECHSQFEWTGNTRRLEMPMMDIELHKQCHIATCWSSQCTKVKGQHWIHKQILGSCSCIIHQSTWIQRGSSLLFESCCLLCQLGRNWSCIGRL